MELMARHSFIILLCVLFLLPLLREGGAESVDTKEMAGPLGMQKSARTLDNQKGTSVRSLCVMFGGRALCKRKRSWPEKQLKKKKNKKPKKKHRVEVLDNRKNIELKQSAEGVF